MVVACNVRKEQFLHYPWDESPLKTEHAKYKAEHGKQDEASNGDGEAREFDC